MNSHIKIVMLLLIKNSLILILQSWSNNIRRIRLNGQLRFTPNKNHFYFLQSNFWILEFVFFTQIFCSKEKFLLPGNLVTFVYLYLSSVWYWVICEASQHILSLDQVLNNKQLRTAGNSIQICQFQLQ